jgi:predicted permease
MRAEYDRILWILIFVAMSVVWFLIWFLKRSKKIKNKKKEI